MKVKRCLAAVLTAAMILTSLPMTAFAADSQEYGAEAENNGEENSAVAFAAATKRTTALDLTTLGTADMLTNEGWAWDKDSLTLTLDGIDIKTAETPAITVPAGATIILADGSDNSIETTASGGAGIICNGNLTMETEKGSTTDGKLTIKAESGLTRGIALKDIPDYDEVEFTFSGVELDITARRGIQMLVDDNDTTKKRDYTMVLDGVDYTFANNANVTYFRSLQVWVDDNGSANITLKNSIVNATGDIYCVGYDADSKATVDIIGSTVNITGTIYDRYADQCIITIEDNSNINVLQIHVQSDSGTGTLSKLVVTDSEMVAGPLNTTYSPIEVGVNTSKESEAIIKNSKITAVSIVHSAISVSIEPTDKHKTDAEKEENKNNGITAAMLARGTLTMENCEILALGAKDFQHAENDNHVHGNHITCIVLPDGMSVEPDKDDATVLKVSITKDLNNNTITSGGATYIIEDKELKDEVLTVDTKNDTVTIPAGTVLKMNNGNVTISSAGAMIFEPGHVVQMPGNKETTVTIGNDTIVIKPADDAPLYIDENGVVDIPAGATVKVGNNESVTVDKDSYIKDGALAEKGKDFSETIPASVDITATYGEKIELSVNIGVQTKTKVVTPAQDMVAFYCGDNDLGQAQVAYNAVATSGTAVLEYDTANDGIPVGNGNIITVRYGGGIFLMGSENNIIVNLSDKIGSGETAEINGVVITGPASVAKENGKLEVTVEAGGKIGDAVVPEGVEVTVPADQLSEVKKDADDNIVLPEGAEVEVGGSRFEAAKGEITVDKDGNIIVDEDEAITVGGTTVTGPAEVDKDGNIAADATVTVGGKKYTVESGTVTVNPDGSVEIPAGTVLKDEQDETLEFPYGGSVGNAGDVTANSKPSSGGSKKYSVSKPSADNGTVTVSPSNAKAGRTVTITVTPDEGYELDKLTVTDKNGNEIKLTDNGDGTYSFKMPKSKVEIDAEFEKTEDAFIETEQPGVAKEAIVLTIGSTIVSIDGEYIVNDVAPIIKDSRTMLPIRVIAEALGAKVEWDADAQKVTITKGETVIEIFIGQPYALVNGEPVQLDVPAFIENDRTYLPLRFVAENLGATVLWDGDAKTVTIIPAK